MIKGVIFDFDGIILNSEPIHCAVELELFREMGIHLSEKEYDQFLGISERDTYNQIKEKYGIDFNNDDLLEEKINRFIKYIEDPENIPVIPGIVRVIKELSSKNVKLAIGSSGTKKVATFALKRLNLLHLFTTLVCGSDVERTKPFPDIFEKAQKNLNLNKNECIVIEDAENGILAARKAGIKVIGYRANNKSFDEKAQPDIHIHDFAHFDIDKISSQL